MLSPDADLQSEFFVDDNTCRARGDSGNESVFAYAGYIGICELYVVCVDSVKSIVEQSLYFPITRRPVRSPMSRCNPVEGSVRMLIG
jgi:hypothetical protein